MIFFFFSDPKLHLTPLPTPPFQYVPHFNCWASDWLVCFLETFWVHLCLFMVCQSLNVKEDLQYKFVSSSVSSNVLMEKMMTGAQMLIGDAINSECSWFLNMHPSWFLNMQLCIQTTGTRNLDFQCVASFDIFERRYRKINLTEYILDVKSSGGRYHTSMAQNTFVQQIHYRIGHRAKYITNHPD